MFALETVNQTHAPFSGVLVDAKAAKVVQDHIMKGLLDLIVLQLLNGEPMHGYQMILRIRKKFGVYYGPSTVYPLLIAMQKKGYVTSQWSLETERPRKTYTITIKGQNLLAAGSDTLKTVRMKLGLE